MTGPRDQITSRQVMTLGAHGPGELLTMGDRSEWFHPYTGAAPIRTNRRALNDFSRR